VLGSAEGCVSQDDSPATSPVRPGDVVADKYVVERVLGVGGMGVVVAARHLHVHHRVALKFLARALATDPAATARFLREGQAAGAIRCEYVVRTIDAGKLPDGVPYLVMELLEGADLARTLELGGPLAEETAVGYLLEALVAVSEAHALGIVHRDLKPSNLFLATEPDGSTVLKILDFGISKVSSAPGAGAAALTATGSLLGSPLYMSPEQIRSPKLVDHRSDLWSLGVILHELVTGRHPFTAEQVPGVLAAIVADAPPSVRSLRPELSRGLEAVVLCCLSKDPNGRFPTAAAMAEALAPLAAERARALVQRIVANAARMPADLLATAESAPAPPRIVSIPASAAATAEGWAQQPGTGRESRLLRRPLVLVLAGALAVVGLLVWRGLAPADDRPVAESEAHSASPRQDPVNAPLSLPHPPVPVVPEVQAAPPASSTAAADASSREVRRTKPPTRTRVKPTPTARPKPSGPRDPSELIDDRR
jgi:eukaryotic-like serine/threonine-protein kinase